MNFKNILKTTLLVYLKFETKYKYYSKLHINFIHECDSCEKKKCLHKYESNVPRLYRCLMTKMAWWFLVGNHQIIVPAFDNPQNKWWNIY